MCTDITITAQRELIGAVAAFYRHDNCYRDDCRLAPEPHTPCNPGFLLVRQIQCVIDFLGEIQDQDAKGGERAA